MSDNTKVIDKVRKLLARADESRNDNEHERAIALRQAHALLAKHGLALADVDTADSARDELGALGRSFAGLQTRFTWEAGIWTAIARLNACQCIDLGIDGATKRKRLAVIGRRLRVDVTKSVAGYVVASVQREAQKWGRDATAFGVGAWTGISQQVDVILAQQARGEINGEQLPQSTALAVIDQHKQAIAEVKDATGHFYPKLRSKGYTHRGNRDATGAGRAYGAKVSLNNQIGGNTQRRIGGA